MNNVESRSGRDASDHHAYHDPLGPAKLSTTVVHALADVMDEDVTAAGLALSDTVDPDALDHLFERSPGDPDGSPSHVAFTVDGYRTTVYSTGEVVITPPAPATGTR